jgi:hypothetical protein
MRKTFSSHPDQLPLNFRTADELEQLIESRVAERCAEQSYRWRLKLVIIESILLSILVAAAGLTLGEPTRAVLRAAVLIGLSCFLTGVMLVGLSALSARIWNRLLRRRPA